MMTMLMFHPMMIEASLQIRQEILEMRKVHQKKSRKEMTDARERDQLKKRRKRPSQKNKKNSVKSSASKKTSHNLKTVSVTRRAARKKKPRQQTNETKLVINLINFTFKCY